MALLWSVPLPLAMLLLALLFGVNGEISPLHARLLPATLVAAIFTLSIVGMVPIWQGPLLYLVGTIWYGAFTRFWFVLWKGQPIRETLNQLYRSWRITLRPSTACSRSTAIRRRRCRRC